MFHRQKVIVHRQKVIFNRQNALFSAALGGGKITKTFKCLKNKQKEMELNGKFLWITLVVMQPITHRISWKPRKRFLA